MIYEFENCICFTYRSILGQNPVYLTIVVPGVGLGLPVFGDVVGSSFSGDVPLRRFSAATFPFFFVKVMLQIFDKAVF